MGFHALLQAQFLQQPPAVDGTACPCDSNDNAQMTFHGYALLSTAIFMKNSLKSLACGKFRSEFRTDCLLRSLLNAIILAEPIFIYLGISLTVSRVYLAAVPSVWLMILNHL